MTTVERHDIDGKGRTVWDVFNNRRYSIDTYQREYKWQTKQVVELLDDLLSKFLEYYDVKHERTEVSRYGHYFLGSIVLSQKNGDSFIIDGQQRLTTLTLLLIYLNRRQNGFPEDDRVDIEALIRTKKYGKKTFNIDVEERASCIERLYNGDDYEPVKKDPEAVRNMVGRYKDIVQNFPPEITDHALPFFLDWFLNNVHFVEITAYSDDDAYTIFETMNDRGLSLAPLDMLKSFLIANIKNEQDRDQVNRVWKKVNNDLLEHGKEEPADAVKSWLRSQYAETIRERKKGAKPGDFDRLGTEFHRWVRENEKRLELVKSADYLNLVERDYEFYSRRYNDLVIASDERQDGLEVIYCNALLEFTLQYPLLLAPLTPSDSKDMQLKKFRVVGTFIDILLARRIWNFKSIAYSTMQYAMFLVMKDIRRKSIPELVKILKARLASDDINFKTNTVLRLHQQNRYGIKWLLARMTDYCETSAGLPSKMVDYMYEGRKRAYDIEHIWADHWERHTDDFAHKADFDEHRNRLGDLLLLPKTFNESYGDLTYEKKLPHYLKHNLLAQSLNADAYAHNPPLKRLIKSGIAFKGHAKFRKADIDSRQKLYTVIAEHAWNLDRIEESVR